MRMTASWSRSGRIDRIQASGAIDRATSELPSAHHLDIHKRYQTRLMRRVRSPTSFSRSRPGRLASSVSKAGIAAILQ